MCGGFYFCGHVVVSHGPLDVGCTVEFGNQPSEGVGRCHAFEMGF